MDSLIKVSSDDFNYHVSQGNCICLACHSWSFKICKQESRGVKCPYCGRPTVYGFLAAFEMGQVEIIPKKETRGD